jgi:hypothetical protein
MPLKDALQYPIQIGINGRSGETARLFIARAFKSTLPRTRCVAASRSVGRTHERIQINGIAHRQVASAVWMDVVARSADAGIRNELWLHLSGLRI